MSSPIRSMFDQIAHRYDFLNHFLSAGRDVAWRRMCCRALPKQPAQVLLDLCGGTGDFAVTYDKVVGRPGLSLVGDFALQMLARAQPKGAHLVPVQLDAMQLPLPNNVSDVVLNGFGMRNLPDARRGLEEVHRVLRPGGVFVTLEFFRPTNLFTRFFYGVLAPLSIPLVGFLFSGRAGAYDYLVRSIRRFLSVNEYAEIARSVGFHVRKIRACDGGIAYMVLLEKAS